MTPTDFSARSSQREINVAFSGEAVIFVVPNVKSKAIPTYIVRHMCCITWKRHHNPLFLYLLV